MQVAGEHNSQAGLSTSCSDVVPLGPVSRWSVPGQIRGDGATASLMASARSPGVDPGGLRVMTEMSATQPGGGSVRSSSASPLARSDGALSAAG